MMKFRRAIDLAALVKKKSFFLLGPRATGKSFLVREQLDDTAVVIDLLRSDVFLRLSADPSLLESLIDGHSRRAAAAVVIDEVQKIPQLLNEVHRLIEGRGMRFVLTGSEDPVEMKRGPIRCLPWQRFVEELWSDRLLQI